MVKRQSFWIAFIIGGVRMNLEERARNITQGQMVNNIKTRSISWNTNLYSYKKGIKQWYLYYCPSCKEIINFTEKEKQSYVSEATDSKYQLNVLCPKCSLINKIRSTRMPDILGAAIILTNDERVIIANSNAKNYPDLEISKNCKLDELKITDIFSFLEETNFNNYLRFDDLTYWNSVYTNLSKCKDGLNEDVILKFLSSLNNEWSEREYVMAYLSMRDNMQIYNVFEAGTETSKDVLRKFYDIFFKNGLKKSDYTSLKMAVKKKLSKEELTSGEVFTIPLSMAQNAESLEQFSSWRKFFKSNKEKDIYEIIDASAISEKSVFINNLRLAMENTGYTANEITDICLLQKLFVNKEFEKTAQYLSSMGKAVAKGEIKDFGKGEPLKSDFYSILEAKSKNRWFYMYYLESDGSNDNKLRRETYEAILKNAVPQDEVIFYKDDMFAIERDIERFVEVCNHESFLVSAFFDFYEKNIAFLYTNENNTHYILAKKNGRIFFEGERT